MPLSDIDDLLNEEPSSGQKPQRYPVVVIDDDAGIRDGLAFLLEDRYELTLCATAKEGVAAVNEDTCAVILDVKMSEHDGFWACDAIREKLPDVPVIFYSAYQNLKDPYAIINEHRPFGYVAKGDRTDKLLDMLALAVKLQSMAVSNRKLIESLKRSQRPST